MPNETDKIDKSLVEITNRLNEISYTLTTLNEITGLSIKGRRSSDANMIAYLVGILGVTIISNIAIALLQRFPDMFYLLVGISLVIIIATTALFYNSYLVSKDVEKFIKDGDVQMKELYNLTIARMKGSDSRQTQNKQEDATKKQ